MADSSNDVTRETETSYRSTGRQQRPAHLDSLVRRAYPDLHSVARGLLRRHQGSAGLGEASLVHEAYLRLAHGSQGRFRDSGHFRAIATRAMRYVLVDDARRRGASKRGGARTPIDLAELVHTPGPIGTPSLEVIAVRDALERLRELFPRKARVLELRFFAGLSNDEIARETGTSLATVKRDWSMAKAWVFREIHGLESTSRP